jgi:hypothetical protein
VDRAWLRSLVHTSCGPCRSDPEEGQVSFLGAASLTCLLFQSSIITETPEEGATAVAAVAATAATLFIVVVFLYYLSSSPRCYIHGAPPSPSLPLPSLPHARPVPSLPSLEFCDWKRVYRSSFAPTVFVRVGGTTSPLASHQEEADNIDGKVKDRQQRSQ